MPSYHCGIPLGGVKIPGERQGPGMLPRGRLIAVFLLPYASSGRLRRSIHKHAWEQHSVPPATRPYCYVAISYLYSHNMPVATSSDHMNGNGDGHLAATKSHLNAESAVGSSRYCQKRYVPGGDESFEVSTGTDP